MKGDQVTWTNAATNCYVTDALQLPNQEASGDLGRGMHCTNHVITNTGSSQVAGQTGAQIYMERHHVLKLPPQLVLQIL